MQPFSADPVPRLRFKNFQRISNIIFSSHMFEHFNRKTTSEARLAGTRPDDERNTRGGQAEF